LQKLLHEEPYTAEEIEKITGESLTSVFKSSQTSLDVIKAAKHYKLFQVDFLPLKFAILKPSKFCYSQYFFLKKTAIPRLT